MAPIFADATANEAPRMGEMNPRLPRPMSTAHLLGRLRAAMLAALSERALDAVTRTCPMPI